MEDNIAELGRIIICMERDVTHGKTVGNMKENTLTTKNMDMVYIPGQMVVNTMETGKMESNMERANIFCLLESNVREYGKTAIDLNGPRTWRIMDNKISMESEDLIRRHLLQLFINYIHT